MTQTATSGLILVALLLAVLVIIRAVRLSIQNLVLSILGLVIGLLMGALISIPLANLSAPFGTILPIALSFGLGIIMVIIVLSKRQSILHLLPLLRVAPDAANTSTKQLTNVLIDTSAIIDGRIADIAKAGFMHARLLVPRFVLAELQNIADSEDAMRRSRGRRGLETLNVLRELPDVVCDIIEQDVEGVKEVDAKLVAMAKVLSAEVLTTDYNLNRVAQIEGVKVINVNELSNAIRPVVIPGEQMLVKIVQAGKEHGQGVGYLADGTMIVVEHGDKLIGAEVPTEVTRVFQTVAGKMIFATPLKSFMATIQPVKEASPKQPSVITPDSPSQPNSQARPQNRSRRWNNKRNPQTKSSPTDNNSKTIN